MDLAPDGLSYEITGNIGITRLDIVVGPDGTIYTVTLNGGSVDYRKPLVQTDDQVGDFFISCGPEAVCDPVGGVSCGSVDVDSDGDGVSNSCDACPGADDRADLSGDQAIDFDDLARLEMDFGCTTGCVADINNDGHTDMLDAGLLFGAWLCGAGP